MKIERRPFGTVEGTPVNLYLLTHPNGLRAEISNYGGIVVSLWVPDRTGQFADVVLGYDKLEGYLQKSPYFGALIGRYGNRIAKGRFTLNGVTYTLAQNNGENHLHGGLKGFDKAVWEAREVPGVGLELSYLSKDGEEGYPGNLAVTVRYALTNDALRIDYSATTDRDTVVNLTQHSYFNLAEEGDILGHELTLYADHFTPVGEGLIPTGEIAPVTGTPLDFTRPTAIGARIEQDHPQLVYAGGYDHNWALNRGGAGLERAATVYEPQTGRVMEVLTTQPGVQFYSGNFLDGSIIGKGGQVYQRRAGFCLETQHFPDSPNHPNFPSTVLRPGQIYQQTTVYRFSTV
ncbi:MAG TPA: aldose epimerase family protein [Meiothermus sp.]|nr:aldose epimerase family protein [Meiothermus sp.]